MANKRKSPDTLEGVRQLVDAVALWALDRQVGHRARLRHGWQRPRHLCLPTLRASGPCSLKSALLRTG